MAILNITTDFAGQIGVEPRIVRIKTNNTIAQVLAPNFLQAAVQSGFTFFPSDIVALTYGTNLSDFFTLSISDSVITLQLLVSDLNQTHITTWSGVWATAQQGNITYSKIGSLVTLQFDRILVDGNNTPNNIAIDIFLPTNLRPPINLDSNIRRVQPNGDLSSNTAGSLFVNADGNVFFGTDPSGTAFDATTNEIGFFGTSISYLTA